MVWVHIVGVAHIDGFVMYNAQEDTMEFQSARGSLWIVPLNGVKHMSWDLSSAANGIVASPQHLATPREDMSRNATRVAAGARGGIEFANVIWNATWAFLERVAVTTQG